MKLLLLKTLLLRKRRDEGFTLPMVIAIGMVMVLLSAVNLVQSGEENIIAISQEGSSDALAAAELGVSRYRDLLINNRILAVNNLDRWTDPTFDILSEVCTTGIDGTGGWADNTDNGWQDINVGSDPIGSYRIVQYEYDRDGNTGDGNNDGIIDDVDDFDQVDDANNDTDGDGVSDAVGLLTVRGQDTIGSIAQIRVTIPLGVNTQDLDDLQPALWIEQDNPTNIGDVNIDSDGDGVFSESDDKNIVLYRPNECDNSGDLKLAGELAIADARRLPDEIETANIATFTKRKLKSDITDETTTPSPSQPYPANYFNTAVREIVLGTNLDNTGTTQALHSDDRYYYTTDTSNLNVDKGESIIADGTSKVILHVGGNLVIDTGTTTDITNLVNSQFGFKSSEIASYLEIHVEDDVTIKGSGTLNLTGLLRVGGTLDIQGNSTVNVIGAIWTNKWNNNGGATVNITLDDYKYFSITPNRTPAPLTYRPSGWERQEASN